MNKLYEIIRKYFVLDDAANIAIIFIALSWLSLIVYDIVKRML